MSVYHELAPHAQPTAEWLRKLGLALETGEASMQSVTRTMHHGHTIFDSEVEMLARIDGALFEIRVTAAIRDPLRDPERDRAAPALEHYEQSEKAVREIVADLCDRGGLRQAWEEMDTKWREETMRAWERLVDAAIDDARRSDD